MIWDIVVTGTGALIVGVVLGFIVGHYCGFPSCQNAHKKDNGFAALNRRYR